MSTIKQGKGKFNGHTDVSYSALVTNVTESDSDSDCYYSTSFNKDAVNKTESIKLVDLKRQQHQQQQQQRPKRSVTKVDRESRQFVSVAQPSIKRTLSFWSGGIVLTVIIALVVVLIIVPWYFKVGIKQKVPVSPPWTASYDGWGSSAIRLVDLDDDGTSDVLISLTRPANVDDLYSQKTIDKFCKTYGETAPCIGTVKALSGSDGQELWQVYFDSEVFAITCTGIDVNKDGKDDCLLAGRKSILSAVNPKNGSVLWQLKTPFTVNLWNNYMPLVLPDLDGDGVPDLFIAHGGDPTFPSAIHDRQSGRLFLVSGATGKVLGSRYYPMPESKETYMSPLLHYRKDGGLMILFGSGGETVSGCLYAVSVADFYRYVFMLSAQHSAPETVKVPQSAKWGHLVPNNITGVYEIHRAKKKGVMVPPVLVDMNKDGVKDLVVLTFEGDSMLLDGETLAPIWTKSFPGYETYSSPAPGYFNDDDTLDFVTHWSKGAWDKYQSSITIVQDGRDGSVIWSLETSQYEMSSDLVARTTVPRLDAFVVRLEGRMSTHKKKFPDDKIVDRRGKRHLGMPEDDDDGPRRPVCSEEDVLSSTVEVFLISRWNTHSALKIAELRAEKFYYNVTANSYVGSVSKRHEGHEEGDKDDDAPLCAVLKPMERITGAVGDLDGDGSLDAVLSLGSYGVIKDTGGSYISMKFSSKIVKINLSDVLREKKWVRLSSVTDMPDLGKNYTQDFTFLSASEQPWTGYLGNGNSVYNEM